MGNGPGNGGLHMTEAVYWIWLQQALGIGSQKIDRVIEMEGQAKALYEMEKEQLKQTGFLTSEDIRKLKTTSLDPAKRLLERAKKLGCRVVTPDHSDYPDYFLHIHCKPCVLYVLGELSVSCPLSITVVGIRRCTQYGKKAAQMFSQGLAAAGCQVVSGLARGIDQEAHEGALSVHGRTVGFLACGMNVSYPDGSGPLKRRILNEGGALATEFPFDAPPKAHHFPLRNRLMSGISDGTVVVQAPKRSGALITAQNALDQGRDVFAVPGEIFDWTMAGCNWLIDQGCGVAVSCYGILESYFHRLPEDQIAEMIKRVENVQSPGEPRAVPHIQPKYSEPQETANPPKEEELQTISESAQKVYAVLGEKPLDCDAIMDHSGLGIAAVVAALTELELNSRIAAEPGRRYRRKK